MNFWVVVEFDPINIAKFESTEKETTPGLPLAARLVSANSEEEAIREAGASWGWWAAMELPELEPRAVRVVIDGETG
jgi:hypothetical protein